MSVGNQNLAEQYITKLAAADPLGSALSKEPAEVYDAILEMPADALSKHARIAIVNCGIHDNTTRNFLEKLYLRDLKAGVPICDDFMRSVLSQENASNWMHYEALSWFLLKEGPIPKRELNTITWYLETTAWENIPLYDVATRRNILSMHPEIIESWHHLYPYGRVGPYEQHAQTSIWKTGALWSASMKSFPKDWRGRENDETFTSFISKSCMEAQILVQDLGSGELAYLFSRAYIRLHPHLFGTYFDRDYMFDTANQLVKERYGIDLVGVAAAFIPDTILEIDEVDPFALMNKKSVPCAGEWQNYAVKS